MRILIVDDEPPARERLQDLLSDLGPEVIVVGEAGNGLEAVRMAAQTEPDVVLLDIHMPGQDGLATARELSRMARPAAVIFATAHDEHAVEAFELSAVDYLLKPVRRERLAAALERAQRFTEAEWRRLSSALPAPPPAPRRHLCSQGHGGIRLIPIENIFYLRADQKYTTVKTAHEEFLIDDSLKALEMEFGDRFLRVHRNALAAVSHVAGLQRQRSGLTVLRFLEIADTLEISRRHLPSVRARLKSLSALMMDE